MAVRRPLILLLTALAVAASAAPAEAAPLPEQNGGFGITPARRLVIGNPAMDLTPTTVINGTGFDYKVTVFPTLVSQSLDGSFTFAETPRNLAASKIVLTTGPNSFGLGPEGRTSVQLRWNTLPAGKPWVAVGVVFQGVPQGQQGTVHVITRLLSVNFLRLPGNYRIDGQFTGLFPQQYAPRVLRFLARVKNTGEMFAAPNNERFAIRDSTGAVVFSAPWKGTVVLPGARVDFPIFVRKILPAGHYTATVNMDFGAARSKTVPFTLVGPNQLPTPGITIQGLNATGTIGSPAQVTAKILSSGTAPADLTVRLYLGAPGSSSGQNALATDSATYHNLAPGSLTQLSRHLGGDLKTGSYRIILTWRDPTGAPHTLESDFTARPAQSWLDKVWQWIKDHWWLFLLLLILALLAATAYVLNKQRQRQRQMEAELAAARAAIEAGPPAEEHVVTVPAGGPSAELESIGDPDEDRGSEWLPRSDAPDPGPPAEPRREPNAGAEPDPGTDGNPGPEANPGPHPDPGAEANPGPPPTPGANPAAAATATATAAASLAVPGRRPEPAAPPPPAPEPTRAPPPIPPAQAQVPPRASPPVAPAPPRPEPIAPPAAPEPAAPAPTRRARGRRGVAVAAVAALGVAGAVAVIRWRSRR